MKIHQLFFKTNQKTEGLQDLFWDSSERTVNSDQKLLARKTGAGAQEVRKLSRATWGTGREAHLISSTCCFDHYEPVTKLKNTHLSSRVASRSRSELSN